MAGISMNCKNGDVPAFGDCVGSASKALCGLTEAAGQVQRVEQGHSWGIHYITSHYITGVNGNFLLLLLLLFLLPLLLLLVLLLRLRLPIWWVCLIPTVRQDIRGWSTPSSLPKPTRRFRWPVRIS